MSFMRAEARAVLWRWRDVLVGLVVVLLGLWGVLTGLGVLYLLGWVMILVGIGLTVTGWQRARFRAGAGGAGVVQVDEGELRYFGPMSGGMVALSDMVRLELDGRGAGAAWRLHQPGQEVLQIPVDAENAEALFDVFASLPGVRTEKMLAEMRAEMRSGAGNGPVVIWQKGSDHPVVTHLSDMRRLH